LGSGSECNRTHPVIDPGDHSEPPSSGRWLCSKPVSLEQFSGRGIPGLAGLPAKAGWNGAFSRRVKAANGITEPASAQRFRKKREAGQATGPSEHSRGPPASRSERVEAFSAAKKAITDAVIARKLPHAQIYSNAMNELVRSSHGGSSLSPRSHFCAAFEQFCGGNRFFEINKKDLRRGSGKRKSILRC